MPDKCKNCGFESTSSMKFCPECGKRISEAPHDTHDEAQNSVGDAPTMKLVATNASPSETMSIGEIRTMAVSPETGIGDDAASSGIDLEQRYEFIERIKTFGVTSAWKAQSRQGNLPVEIFRIATGESFDLSNERVDREFSKLKQMECLNVAKVLDWGREPGGVAVVCEYVGEQTLRDRIETADGVGFEEALELAIGIARGLDGIHRLQVVHLRLCPELIRIVDQGGIPQPRITGCGLGLVALHQASVDLKYLAPEIGENSPGAVNHTADVFSLGVIIAELIGRVDGETDLPEGVRAEALRIAAQCMKGVAVERYFGANDVARDLNRILATIRNVNRMHPIAAPVPVATFVESANDGKCRNCGGVVSEAEIFCGACGQRLRPDAPAQSPQRQVSPVKGARDNANDRPDFDIPYYDELRFDNGASPWDQRRRSNPTQPMPRKSRGDYKGRANKSNSGDSVRRNRIFSGVRGQAGAKQGSGVDKSEKGVMIAFVALVIAESLIFYIAGELGGLKIPFILIAQGYVLPGILSKIWKA